MLTTYAQYSFGGYKIYRLSGNSAEEVTGQNRLGLPQSAVQLFSHYGIKLLCSSDMQGNYILFVNDMPCKEKDDMGRAKTCSMLITSRDRADIYLLRRIAVMIAFEMDEFEEFFSSLFSIGETLTFDTLIFENFLLTTSKDSAIAVDRLRSTMASKANAIIVYATTNAQTAIEPLFKRFEKNELRHAYLMKWDDTARKIKDNSIERIGFMRLIQKIINKIVTIWRN